MYRVDRNNFYQEQKKATIQTPPSVSRFIYNLVSDKIDKKKSVLDPSVGAGALLAPFVEGGYRVFGVDIEEQGFPQTKVKNYLAMKKGELETPGLIVVNPPFNIDAKTKTYIKEHYSGRPLLSEVWLQKGLELFGDDIPVVLFTPYGLRLNQTTKSQRWGRFIRGEYPEIKSIISLPKNIFAGIQFHSEILIFNIDGLKAHYFYSDEKE